MHSNSKDEWFTLSCTSLGPSTLPREHKREYQGRETNYLGDIQGSSPGNKKVYFNKPSFLQTDQYVDGSQPKRLINQHERRNAPDRTLMIDDIPGTRYAITDRMMKQTATYMLNTVDMVMRQDLIDEILSSDKPDLQMIGDYFRTLMNTTGPIDYEDLNGVLSGKGRVNPGSSRNLALVGGRRKATTKRRCGCGIAFGGARKTKTKSKRKTNKRR